MIPEYWEDYYSQDEDAVAAQVALREQVLDEKGPAIRQAIFAKFDALKSLIMLKHLDANLKVC